MPNEHENGAMTRVEVLLTALVKLQMGPILEEELKDETDRQLYELTGTLKRREIEKKLKISPGRISAAWQRWERLGLMVKDGQAYRRTV